LPSEDIIHAIYVFPTWHARGENVNTHRVLIRKLTERNHFEDLGVERRIILKWVLKKQGGERGLNSCGSVEGQVAGCCESCNELPGFIKCGEILD